MREVLKQKLNKKGFTLAELLIVVAIIAILAAIAFPVFSAQLEKAKAGADLANLRSAISIASTELTLNNKATEAQLETAVKEALGNPTPQLGTEVLDIVLKASATGSTTKVVDLDNTKFGGHNLKDLIDKTGATVSPSSSQAPGA